MKKHLLTTIIVINVIIILCSCESKEKKNDYSEVMYEILYKENEIYSKYLIENIDYIIREHSTNKNMIKFDSLTKKYIQYLEEVKHEIEKESTKFFFTGSNYSSKGEEFIRTTNNYLSNIESMQVSNNLKKRMQFVLNTKDIETIEINGIVQVNRNNDLKGKRIYIDYLGYYYAGCTINQALAHFSSKKKVILEIENEFLHEITKEVPSNEQ